MIIRCIINQYGFCVCVCESESIFSALGMMTQFGESSGTFLPTAWVELSRSSTEIMLSIRFSDHPSFSFLTQLNFIFNYRKEQENTRQGSLKITFS